MIDNDIGAIEAAEFLALRHRLDADDKTRAAKSRRRDRHQAHWAESENGNRTTHRNVRVLRGHEAGREHVAAVDRRFVGDVAGNMRHVGVGLVHVEVLGEGAVLDIGEFPAAEGGARL